MFNTILVPLDGSPLAETALDPALLLARRFEAEMLLVRAVVPEASSADEAHALRPVATYAAQRYLASVAHYVRGEGVVAQTVVLPLEPAEGIAEKAAPGNVDLIVMTTHGRTGIEALLHPSVTWQVLRQTSAPILACRCANADDPAAPSLHLARFMTDPHAPILVPLDGSLQAETALPLAQELARVFGNRLLLLRAGERPSLVGGMIGDQLMLDQPVVWSLDEAESYLKRKALELARAGLAVETATAIGGAAPFIRQVAAERQAGLIVMASHGRGWLGRFVLGSVAESVLCEGATPVLLVRRQPLPTGEEQVSAVSTAREKQAIR